MARGRDERCENKKILPPVFIADGRINYFFINNRVVNYLLYETADYLITTFCVVPSEYFKMLMPLTGAATFTPLRV